MPAAVEPVMPGEYSPKTPQYIRWENDHIKTIRNQDALKVIHDLYKQKGLVHLNYI